MADLFYDLKKSVRQVRKNEQGLIDLETILSSDALKKFKQLDQEWRDFSREVLEVTMTPEDDPFATAHQLGIIHVFLQWLFIKGLPQTEAASTSGRSKPLASVSVIKDLLYFLWACDEYRFKHPRIRVQLSFAILVLLYQGLRPGEFTECSSLRGQNQGFAYGDFALMLVLQPGGREPRWVLRVTIRHRKNHRGVEKDDVEHILTDEPGQPHLCPVTHFCALAFADGAFENLKSPDDLMKVRPKVDVKIKESMRGVPVLERLAQGGKVSPTLVFTADSLGSYLNGLGDRAGYKESLTAYAFRRAHGNMLDQRVTGVQRRQRMGHKSDDTFQYYISRVSGVDTQSLVLGREPRQDLLDHVRSMAMHQDTAAPSHHGSRLTHARRRYTSPSLSSSQEPEHPTVSQDPTEVLPVQIKPQRDFDARRIRRRLAYSRDRTRFFENKKEVGDAEKTLELKENDDQTQSTDSLSPYIVVRPGPSKYLLPVLRFEPARLSVIENISTEKGCSPTLVQGIVPLQTLSNAHPRPIYYHDAEPDEENGCCRRCKKQVSRETKAKSNRHLLLCLKNELAEQGRRIVTNCFNEKQLTSCSWSCCNHSFGSSKAGGIVDHITRHVKCSGSNTCWWEECGVELTTKSELSMHLLHEHGLLTDATRPDRPHYCYECACWQMTECSWEEHCARHWEELASVGSFCGQTVNEGVIAVAAKCVFCLGNSTLTHMDRFHQYADCNALHHHIDRHVERGIVWPLECPHPHCSQLSDDEEEFWKHLNGDHGVEPKAPHAIRRKAKLNSVHAAESDEDMESDTFDIEISDASSTTMSTRSSETDVEGLNASENDIEDVRMMDGNLPVVDVNSYSNRFPPSPYIYTA